MNDMIFDIENLVEILLFKLILEILFKFFVFYF